MGIVYSWNRKWLVMAFFLFFIVMQSNYCMLSFINVYTSSFFTKKEIEESSNLTVWLIGISTSINVLVSGIYGFFCYKILFSISFFLVLFLLLIGYLGIFFYLQCRNVFYFHPMENFVPNFLWNYHNWNNNWKNDCKIKFNIRLGSFFIKTLENGIEEFWLELTFS